MSTLATVEQVMRQTQTPMSVRDIVEIAGEALPTRSKTPDTVVARDLSMDIKRLGDDSKFIRTAPGRYTMREFVTSGLIQMGDTGARKAMPEQSSDPTPVLSQALSGERQPVLPAQKPVREDAPRRLATQEDATSL